MHNQIDYVLTDKRQHSYVVDVLSFTGSDCDTDHYLVVEKVRKRLSVSKQAEKMFHMERYNLKNVNDMEVKLQYQVKISNRFAALENLYGDGVDFIKAWESIRI
jgi:hypothetical protein